MMRPAKRKAWAVRFEGASGPNGPVFRLLAVTRAGAVQEAARLGYVDYQDIVPYSERYTRARPRRREGTER